MTTHFPGVGGRGVAPSQNFNSSNKTFGPRSKFEAWPTRIQLVSFDRQKAIFPLPSIRFAGSGSGLSRRAQRCARRRILIFQEANECVDALNLLYGCAQPVINRDITNLESAHQSIHSHILRCMSQRRPGKVLRSRECAHRILGSLTDYSGEESTVRAYDPNLVSIPSGDRPFRLKQCSILKRGGLYNLIIS